MDSLTLIRDFLRDRLDVAPERTQPEVPLADLGVDSLMLLELIFEFEDRFDVKLSQDMKPPHTVGDLVAQMDQLISTPQT